MTKNVGHWDRGLRAVATVALGTCAVMAPLPLPIRIVGFALAATYLLFTALAGTCFGYMLMGRSTCTINTSARSSGGR